MEDFKFNTADISEVLSNRFVVMIGDSNQRGMYKDFVLLLQTDRYLTERELRKKGEQSFLHDELIEGGCLEKMTNGTNYREVRQYRTNVHLVRFYFVTRCYNAYMESILEDLQQPPFPDIVIINSCLWDITRYGSESIPDYKNNLVTLFMRFKTCLPPNCLVIWNTTLPISGSARSGFLIPEVEFKASSLRLDILEANYYAQKEATKRGFDVLDLHFYLRHHLHMRAHDGIHWDMKAHRTISNLLLTHIFEAWRIPLPGKQITFGSYGSAHARNGYYQQLAKDRQLQPVLSQPQLAKNRPQPILQLPSYQLQPCQPQSYQPQSYQPQSYQPQSYQPQSYQLQIYQHQPYQPQPYQPQPYLSQPVQLQPLQCIDFTADTSVSMCSGNFELGVGNMVLQNVQSYDPFHWQPYQQSSSVGSDLGHSHTRYQPYTHRRHDPSANGRYKHCF